MRSRPRGQSELIGVVLLTAVLVIVISVSGLFVVSGFATDPPPRVDIEAEATTQNVTLWHSGGDSMQTADTDVVLRGTERERYSLETFTQLLGGDRRSFEAGDEWSRSHGIDAERMEILVVHEPSNEVVDHLRVDVEQTLGARFEYSPSEPTTADTIFFDGTGSVAAEGTIDSYEWEFGDGTVRTGETAAYSYDSAGEYDVNLTVTSEDGRTATRTRTVVVSNPSPTADFTFEPQSGDRTIEFDASASTAGESGGTIENYTWNFDDGNESTGETDTHTYAADGVYRVTLTVEDDNGATATTGKSVPVNSYFAVSNLVAPNSAQQGEGITVNATVENTGTERRTQTVEYRFDGTSNGSKQVELGYEESTTVSFDYTVPAGQAAGTYTHGVFSQDESQTADIEVTEEPVQPAKSNLSNLDIAGQGDSATATKGDTGDVTVDVTNVGGLEGTFEVNLTITDSTGTDVVTDSQSVTLAGGDTSTVTFTDPISGLDAGEYGVNLTTGDNSTSGTLTVEEQQADTLEVGGTVKPTGGSGKYEFELENTGNIDATLVAIGINETSNSNAVRVDNNKKDKILTETKGGPTIVSETIEFDSTNPGTAERYDFDSSVELAPSETVDLIFDGFKSSSGKNVDMQDKEVTITLWFADGSQTTITLDPNA